MRCFYCTELKSGILSAEDIPEREKNHIFKILRGKEDSEILLIDGKGSIAKAVIEHNHSLRISDVQHLPSPETKVHLFTASPRKNQMDKLLKQCAEVGVWTVTPVITERSIAKPIKESTRNRMKNLLIEGCKQAHNPFLPVLNPIEKLFDIRDQIKACNNAFFGRTENCGEKSRNRKNAGLRNMQLTGKIAWIVGPEGGFTDKEELFLSECGANALQLGSWIMRVETAAIVGAAILIER